MSQKFLLGKPVKNWELAKKNLEEDAAAAKKAQIAISFLVCCYNGEKYIKRCLDSVFGQKSFSSDCEVIVVNDGSTDSSLEILKAYQSSHPELKIITNPENMGLLYARRRATANASGEYIHFVDIDDAVTADCLSAFREVTSEKKDDMIRFNVKLVDPDYNEISDFPEIQKLNRDNNETFSGKEVFEDFFTKSYYPLIWAHWIKKACADKAYSHIPAETVCTMAEDIYQVTLFSYFAQSKRILADRYLYLYTIGSGCSTTFTGITLQKAESAIYSVLTATKGIQNFLKEMDLLEEYKENYIACCKYLAGNIYSKIFPLNEKERQTLFASLFHWGIDNLTLQGIAKDLLGNEENAGKCISRNMFPVSVKPIRTVALYYHRVSNGGVERLIAKLADFFVSIGYKVVLLLDKAPDEQSYQTSNRVIYRTFSSGLVYDATPDGMTSRIAEWQKFIREEEIDLVLYNASSVHRIVWDFLAVKLENCKFMVYAHSSCSAELVWTRMAKLIFPGTDGLICLSRVDSVYYQLRGCNPCYVPNMVTIEQPEISNFKPKNNDIVWIGRLDQGKQPMDAVKAFALIHKKVPDARLIFVGKGEEGDTIEDDLKAAAKEFGIEKNVVFAGFTTNVAEHLKNAAVFLFTSKYEGFSLVISEAKAYGLPIVSYDLPYMETFRTCEGHILVEQGDYQALADETAKVLLDPALREEMARKAYDSIKYFLNYPYEQKWKEIFAAVEKGEKICSLENSMEDLAIAAKVLIPAYENVILDTQRDIGNLHAEISRLWYYCQEKDTTLTELLKYARLINLVKRILPEGSLRRKMIKAPLKIMWKCLKFLCGKR